MDYDDGPTIDDHDAISEQASVCEAQLTSVSQSFSQREIFFTGANGFLGKVILGLLLDRVSEFERLHILMRPRTGLSGGERFQTEVLGSPPLAGIGARRGADFLREKIHVIAGELSAPGCGLAEDEVAGLAGRVSLIINCA
ncbi:MAG: SDR family oxidoreductase, partial [Terriglobia bacterium]